MSTFPFPTRPNLRGGRPGSLSPANRALAARAEPGVWAESVLLQYKRKACPGLLAEELVEALGLERVVRLAGALIDQDPAGTTPLLFAAQAATLAGDPGRALELLERVRTRGSEIAILTTRAAALAAAGQLARAAADLEEVCWGDLFGRDGQVLRARVLGAIHRRLAMPGETSCPCGSHRPFARCCQPAEREVVRRFSDGSRLAHLRAAYESYARGSDWWLLPDDEREVGEFTCLEDWYWRPDVPVDDWFARTAAAPWHAAEREWFGRIGEFAARADRALRFDWALTMLPERPERQSVVSQFAWGERSAGPLSALAMDWMSHHRFGAWQVGPQAPGPGLLVTEMVTGLTLYAAVRPAAPPPPWSVLLAMMVPDEGVWRPGAGLVALSPVEGDAFVSYALRFGARTPRRPAGRPADPVAAEVAPGLLGETDPLADQAACEAADRVAQHFPYLAVAARFTRAAADLDDGEPWEWLEARFTVPDWPALRRLLEHREDVIAGPRAELWWYRTPVSGLARERAAEFPARPHCDRPGLPQRFTGAKAVLRREPKVVVLQASSRRRYEEALAALRELAPTLTVVSEWCETPGVDAPFWAGDEAGSAEWEAMWAATPHPRLGGLTPRQAMTSTFRGALEVQLRDLEYHAHRARLAGHPAPDVGRLRDLLGRPSA
ncbi:MAG TPA: hypothetical protein VFW71_06025 [Actinomycetota bacterium]|nr:hypothetical protein [Actinomycetota bacterium]